jgi:RimJ/RimL family protein N-acetyltransferase
VGLNPFLEDEYIPEIEWQIGPEHWGKGYATEVGLAMLAYGFQEAGFPAIMGFALSQHVASRRVMEKIGMTYLHDKEDHGPRDAQRDENKQAINHPYREKGGKERHT